MKIRHLEMNKNLLNSGIIWLGAIFCCLVFFTDGALAKKHHKASKHHKSAAISNDPFYDLRRAQYYFLMDEDTKEVLLEKNSDLRLAPSSMTKIMTAYVVFDQVKQGRIKFDNRCLIGKDAWRKYGSSMFLNYHDVVKIDDLIKGLLVFSGNDAAIALAQVSAGGTDNFITLMNLKAKELGLKNSSFKNPHGLNQEGHYMSLRDLATLTLKIRENFPECINYFSLPTYTYRNITERNHNPLIRGNYPGATGMKTGLTRNGGFGVVGTVTRGNRRLIAVVNKARSSKQRERIVTQLLNYGFDYYKKIELFKKDQTVSELDTWLGSKDKVAAVPNQDVALTLRNSQPFDSIKISIKYSKPLYAPIAKGSKIATLMIEIRDPDNHKSRKLSYDLFAKENIDKVKLLKRIDETLRYKIQSFTEDVLSSPKELPAIPNSNIAPNITN